MVDKLAEEVVARVRASFNIGKTISKASREKNLKELYQLVDTHTQEFIDAMHKDLRKPSQESRGYEIDGIKGDITSCLNDLDSLMGPQDVHDGSFLLMGKKAYLHPEPYGVVLIIGAWNYPLQLTLLPLVGAIAAGNCAIIKPSEIASQTASLLEKLFELYMDPECFQIVNGDATITQSLLRQRFDYIMYTGNGRIGRIVMEAASKHLTPVTLELGGKSPAVVDSQVNISQAAKRIVWGKYVNSGQTCIAPDYVICEEKIRDHLVAAMKKYLKEFYGDDPQKSKSLGRIVNDRHFERISSLLEKNSEHVVVGGETDAVDRYIAPTFLVDVPLDGLIMQEEIFGPLLPIVTVKSIPEAVDFINERDKPLVLYVFSDNQSFTNRVISRTSSGAVVVNDTLTHAGVDVLPFGGVGQSGMGAYHGRHSFDTFTHKKPCFVDPYYRYTDFAIAVRYPPYTSTKEKIVSYILRKTSKAELRVFYLLKLTLVVLLISVCLKYMLRS